MRCAGRRRVAAQAVASQPIRRNGRLDDDAYPTAEVCSAHRRSAAGVIAYCPNPLMLHRTSRHQATKVARTLKTSSVINVVGPRQTGKTTLVRDILHAGRFLNLDDEGLLFPRRLLRCSQHAEGAGSKPPDAFHSRQWAASVSRVHYPIPRRRASWRCTAGGEG